MEQEQHSQQDEHYTVLARKYRPSHFGELIGQDALVQTLSNAIQSGRIAHAFMLTGVRGVGKTTTARIIAKALNYTGPDGQAGPTTGPTDDCETCQAITQDRHPDIMEMDAASRTGVDDIREILDGVRYAPVSARYKIYIIDEVHMLSKNAFNALLKTLEEPPSNVKFIFATTEIRKVPVTILSRCQRFDLRRIDVETLSKHYQSICEKEGVQAEDEAIAMIAGAADGSVRDGLSLLDQAIALASDNMITATSVSAMIGATDRLRILDLLDSSLAGEPKKSLEIMHDLYRMGAAPTAIIQDVMDMIHAISHIAIDPQAKPESLPHAARDKAQDMATRLTQPQLQKSWQILLKGIGELNTAPHEQKAAEMIILRLIYAANLPDPADLIKKIKNGDTTHIQGSQTLPSSGEQSAPQMTVITNPTAHKQTAVAVQQAPDLQTAPLPQTMEEMIALFENNGEMIIGSQLYHSVACVTLKPGHFEFVPDSVIPTDFASRVRTCLNQWTGENWVVSIANNANAALSLAAQKKNNENAAFDAIKKDPQIARVLTAFPDAEIIQIHDDPTKNETP